MIIRMLKKNKILKEISWSFFTIGVVFLLYFSLNIYLARSLGVEKFGSLSFFLSILSIFILLSGFGINVSTSKYVAQYNKTEKLITVLNSGIKLRFIFSLFFSIIIAIFHNQLALFVGKPELSLLFLFAAPLLFFSGVVAFLKKVFQGLHRLKYNFIINFLENGLKLVLVVIFFTFSSEIFSIINAFVLSFLITSFVGFYLLYKNFYKKYKTNYKEKSFSKDIFEYSIPLLFISIGFAVAMEVDILMLGLLTTDREVGIYTVAKKIAVKLPHISIAISMGVMPLFVKFNNDKQEKLKKIFYTVLKINTLIFFIIALVIFFFSPFFIPLIFGSQYSSSALSLQILTVYLVAYSFSILLSSFLNYQGLAKKRAVNLSFSIFLNIVLNFALIPSYGAVGAAISTSVSYLPYVFLNWRETKKILECRG